MKFAAAVIGILAVVVTALPAGAARPRPESCVPGTQLRLSAGREGLVGVARHPLAAFGRPGGGGAVTFGVFNTNGFPTTFRIVGAVLTRKCQPYWYRVQLPMRPNGAVGYVRARALAVRKVTTRIVVDLSERRLTLLVRGKPVLRTRVAVGASATPTPIGHYYVNQRLLSYDPSGPYGPAALGISAFSRVLTGWTQGGPIGIHGTNEPWLLGQAVSNGCIRVENSVLKRLFARTPAGTPVVVHL
jgi:hypothetical protein